MELFPNDGIDYYDSINRECSPPQMNCYLFDVDGTLTPPRTKIDSSFETFFLSWVKNKKVYLVTGSDVSKLKEQIPQGILAECSGIFTSMGNEFWKGEELVYRNDFTPPVELKEMLISFQMYTRFPVRIKKGGRGAIIENRPGMINFTTIGRNADTEERNRYCEWDRKHKERENIAKEIENKFPELEIRIGGQISVDIQPRGYNKSQASEWIRLNEDKLRIIFFGDSLSKNGNDADAAQDILAHGGTVHSVGSYLETREMLSCY